jgi:type II secretory pathway predicted ATPase ExeA
MVGGDSRAVWKRHWGLNKDPFLDRDTCYVPLPGHQEAVARLVHTIDAGDRLSVLSGSSGLGKTRVLTQALLESRSPLRRLALVSDPIDAASLFAGLAGGLGVRHAGTAASLAAGWRALQHEIRLRALEGAQVILAVDGCHTLAVSGGTGHLGRLAHLGGSERCAVTVLIVVGNDERGGTPPDRLWTLAVRLKPFTRSETGTYLAAKLAAAGCSDPLFSPRAVTRLHALSGGIPRGLDRLASLSLMAGASRGLEAIASEVVDAVSYECHLPAEPSPRE